LYQNVIRTRKYDALLFGEQIGKDRDLYAFWHSSQRNSPGLNVAMYTNSTVDKLLSDIRNTRDEETLDAAYAKLDETIRSDIPAVFLYSPSFIYVIPKKLRGLELDVLTVPADRWNSVVNWYLSTENVWKIFAKN
jgi:peptide/nickel transport system substrate-binding protein